LSPRLREFLLAYGYPGNIRELRNLMYRLSCLAGDSADLAHLPEDIRPAAPGAATAQGLPARYSPPPPRRPRWPKPSAPPATRPSAPAWSAGLKDVGGTVAELARRWDMNRSHLQILLKKHGLHSKDFRQRGSPSRLVIPGHSTRERRVSLGQGRIHHRLIRLHIIRPHHHHRNIVAPARGQGQPDEGIGRLRAIAAQSARRTWPRGSTALLRPSLQSRKMSPSLTCTCTSSSSSVCSGAERARDHVGARPGQRVLARKVVPGLEFLELVVVARELVQAAAAAQVDAAVAGPDAGGAAARGQQQHQGGADHGNVARGRLRHQRAVHPEQAHARLRDRLRQRLVRGSASRASTVILLATSP
jgi:hypothetical protein